MESHDVASSMCQALVLGNPMAPLPGALAVQLVSSPDGLITTAAVTIDAVAATATATAGRCRLTPG